LPEPKRNRTVDDTSPPSPMYSTEAEEATEANVSEEAEAAQAAAAADEAKVAAVQREREVADVAAQQEAAMWLQERMRSLEQARNERESIRYGHIASGSSGRTPIPVLREGTMAAGAACSAAVGHVPLTGEGETLMELTPEATAAAWAGVGTRVGGAVAHAGADADAGPSTFGGAVSSQGPTAVDGPTPEEAAEEGPSTSAEAAQLSTAMFSEADVESLAAVLEISTGAAQKKLECMDVSSHAGYSGQLLQLAVAQHYSGLAAKKR
jgi:hypothetical protein